MGSLGSVLAVALGVTVWGTGRAAQNGFVLRDDLQREVSFARPPQRLISLLPSLTETVCALDACDRLVATDRFSNWPEAVKALPKVGGLDDASLEAIVAFKPDLILLSHSQRIIGRLDGLGLRSFAVNTQTLADIDRTVQIVGRILGVPDRAQALTSRIDHAVRDIGAEALAHRAAPGPTVYYEEDPAPYAAGPESFIGELLSRLGARNIVTRDLGPYPKLNPEYVVQHDPDVIFISPSESLRLKERPGWDTIRAVKERRLCSFTPAVRDTIVRAGPRVAEGMRALRECLERVAP